MYNFISQNELTNTDLLFGQLWEVSVDGMRLIDEDGTILLVNDAFCKLFELPREELIGKPFSVVYIKDEQEYALKSFRTDIRSNEIKTFFERENTLWNGTKCWLEFSNSFLTLPDGNKITLSIIKNITDRKYSEIELRESESKFKILFNNTKDAVFVTQLSDDKFYGDFIEVNETACKRLGYTKEEFLKLSPSAIISPKSMDDFNIFNQQLLNNGHVIYEIVHRAKDKKLFTVEVNSHLFIYNNKKTVLSVARDISERKKAEEKLTHTGKQLRELATHLQSVREDERTMIAREIHDELGQVLTTLKIQIALLSNKLNVNQSDLKDKINSLLKMIDDSVESVQKISGKLRPGILDELGLVPAIEWQTEEFEKTTGIKCSLILPRDVIVLDENKSTALFRIFQESLTNIARHSNASRVSVNLLKSKQNVVLEIKDNGIGITKDQIKDVKSLGILGMKERALVLGGEISIEGFPAKGTLIKAEIPFDEVKNA